MKILSRKALTDLPALSWLIEGLIPEASLGVLWGFPKSLKSFCTMSMACSVATGKDWMGNPTLQGQVLYVAAEGWNDLNARIEAWEYKHEKRANNLFFVCQAIPLIERANIELFAQEIRTNELRPKLIVIDTLHRCSEGTDENSATAFAGMLANLDYLRREFGSTIILVHHCDKQGMGARGSGALRGAVDFEFQFVRESEAACVMICRSQKYAREASPVHMLAVENKNSLVLMRGR